MPKKVIQIEWTARFHSVIIVDEDVEIDNDLTNDVDIPENPTSKYVDNSYEVLNVKEASKDDMDALTEYWGQFITSFNCDDVMSLCNSYLAVNNIQLTIADAKDFFDLGTQWLEEHDGEN